MKAFLCGLCGLVVGAITTYTTLLFDLSPRMLSNPIAEALQTRVLEPPDFRPAIFGKEIRQTREFKIQQWNVQERTDGEFVANLYLPSGVTCRFRPMQNLWGDWLVTMTVEGELRATKGVFDFRPLYKQYCLPHTAYLPLKIQGVVQKMLVEQKT